jgi:D-alanyl-D-alanine carboxypeptidase (penicillin-binding protein 5/6)
VPRGARRPPLGQLSAAILAGALLCLLLLLPRPAVAQSGVDPAGGGPDVDAAAWILLDARDGEQLAAKDEDRERAIASTTKLMTAYLALDELPLKKRLTVPPYAAGPAESVAGLTEGEKLTVHDLLRALLLPSANDAAETIALGIAPSEAEFVERMNEAAGDLGLERTNYANPIGLDDPLNFSTASDLAKLTLELRRDERFRDIVRLSEATLESGAMERRVVSTNTLMLSDPSVDGVKTGHTLEAGYVLIASAERRGIPLVSVVLGAPSEAERDASSERLLDYGYSLYRQRHPFERDEELASAAVHYEDQPLGLLAGRGLAVAAREDQRIETDVEAPAQVEGPVAEGERLGRVTVSLDGEVVGRVPLLAAQAIAEPSFADRVGGPLVVALAALVLIVILIAVLILGLRRARGERSEGSRSSEERMRSREERTLKRQDRGTPE